MILAKRAFLVLIGISLIAVISLADNTGSVSIVGKDDDASNPHTVGITLFLDTSKWSKSEPGDRSHFFSTKTGSYVRVNNVISLLDKDKNKVGELSPLVPSQAKKGDRGNGKSFESGLTFKWEVQ